MSTRRGTFIALFATVSTLASSAAADGAKLTYARSAGASACPDESDLREAVAQKVGRDPFDGEDAFVDVGIEGTTGELVATVEVREGGVVRGRRILSSTSASCDELASALVVTISIALDPARFGVAPRRAAPPPAASAPEGPLSEDVAPRPAPQPTQERRRPSWDIAAAGGAAFGVAPATATAVSASFGARWPRASLEAEGRVHLPASEATASGSVSVSSSLAAIVPCLRAGPLAFCAVGAIGAVRGEGRGVLLPATDSAVAAAAGARLAAELDLAPRFGLRAGVDAMATVHGTRVVLDGREAWSTPSLWGFTWAGVVVHFP